MNKKRPADDLANLDVTNTGITTRAEQAVRESGRAEESTATESRTRGRPPKGRTVATTLRLTPEAWAALQQQAVTETVRTGRKRHISDVVADALTEYYANHAGDE